MHVEVVVAVGADRRKVRTRTPARTKLWTQTVSLFGADRASERLGAGYFECSRGGRRSGRNPAGAMASASRLTSSSVAQSGTQASACLFLFPRRCTWLEHEHKRLVTEGMSEGHMQQPRVPLGCRVIAGADQGRRCASSPVYVIFHFSAGCAGLCTHALILAPAV